MALLTDTMQAFQYPEHIDFVYGNPTLITQFQWDPNALSDNMSFPLPCGVAISATNTSFSTATPGWSTYGTTSTIPLGILFNRCDTSSTPFSIVQPDGELVLRIPTSSMALNGTPTNATGLYWNTSTPYGGLTNNNTQSPTTDPAMTLVDMQGEYALVKFNMAYWDSVVNS